MNGKANGRAQKGSGEAAGQGVHADGPLAAIAATSAGGCGAKLLRIGELARRSGKTVRALHLYEELSLLRPSNRSQGGFRLYDASSVERVEWISKLQDAGFSLAELQGLLSDVLREQPAPEAMARMRAVFEEKLRDTREQRRRLEKLEADLASALEYLDGCRGCAPDHGIKDCPDCHINGHEGQRPPTLVNGIHHG